MQADGGTDELRQEGRDLGIAREVAEEGVALEDGGLQSPHAGQRGAVAGFEVVEIVVGGDAAGLRDQLVCETPQLAELRALDQARDDQVAVAAISLDLLIAEHG